MGYVMCDAMIMHDRLMIPATRSGMKDGSIFRRLMCWTKKDGIPPREPTISPIISI